MVFTLYHPRTPPLPPVPVLCLARVARQGNFKIFGTILKFPGRATCARYRAILPPLRKGNVLTNNMGIIRMGRSVRAHASAPLAYWTRRRSSNPKIAGSSPAGGAASAVLSLVLYISIYIYRTERPGGHFLDKRNGP